MPYSLDLLHVHYAIPHSVSALLARQMIQNPSSGFSGRTLPFITTLHGTDITLVGLDSSYLPITRFGIQQSDGVTAISAHLRDRTLEAFDITSEIEVIRNFVNCDVYVRKPDLVAAMRPRYASPDEKLLVHLSNFRPVKRVTDAVEVFAQVARAIPARLMLIGDGPDRSTAEYLAARRGVQDRVHFLGKQDNVQDLIPLADLMLMPSEMESFGLAALEAMACRVPTIATRVGGVPELIDDGITGLLFSVGDVEAMSKAAIELLSDSTRLETLSRAARKTAQDHFCSTSHHFPLRGGILRNALSTEHNLAEHFAAALSSWAGGPDNLFAKIAQTTIAAHQLRCATHRSASCSRPSKSPWNSAIVSARCASANSRASASFASAKNRWYSSTLCDSAASPINSL